MRARLAGAFVGGFGRRGEARGEGGPEPSIDPT
jgi:hypothetical protein